MNVPLREPHPFRLSTLLFNAALVLPPPFLYSVKTDSPVYFLIAGAILLFAFFRKDYLPVRDRPIIYSITAAVVLTVFPDMLITIDDSRAGIFDLLIRSNLIIPLMTYLAAFSCAFYPYPLRRGITAVCVVFALVICGDRFYSVRLNNETLFFLNGVLHHYAAAYGFAAAWTALAIPLYFIFPGRVEKSPATPFSMKLRPVLLFLLLLLLPLFALAAEHYYYRNDSMMRAVEYYLLRISMRRHFDRPDSRHYRLNGRISLNRPVPHDPARGRQVLIRVKAPFVPGYLRTGVFCSYRSGQWDNPKDSPAPVPLPASRPTGLVSYSTFTLPGRDAEGSGRKMELYFVRLNPGPRVPAPGNVNSLEAVADSGAVSENGLLELKHWRLDGGCTLIVPAPDREAAWQGPADPLNRAEFLQIPERLRPELKRISANLQISSVAPQEEILRKVQQYFEPFTYSTEHRNAGQNMDPLLYFLRQSRTGHCEFFASASVLLFRSAGIPARYVTGFICEEKNPVGDYYVVRAAHAHAWCEAYLPGSKRWVTVDPAAGSALTAFQRERGQYRLSVWLDAAQQIFQQAFADIRRGHFAQAVMDLLQGLATLLWRIVSNVFGAIGILIVVFLAVFLLIRKRRRASANGGYALSGPRQKLVRIFERFERSFRAHTGEKRPEHTAVLEFYRQPELQEFCRTYERLRFGAVEPDRREIRDFADAAAGIRILMRKTSFRDRQADPAEKGSALRPSARP